jgi:hypothetical protein
VSPRDKTQAKLYDAIHEFNKTACWPVLQHAQHRQYLAEHLANVLVPSWLHDRECRTAGEEIAHVLLMVGLFPPDWMDAYRTEVLVESKTGASTAPSFFQPGHTYTRRDDSTFRCIAVTTHPDSGERVAIGWHTDTAGWTFIDVRNINHWNHEYDGVEPPAESGEAQ